MRGMQESLSEDKSMSNPEPPTLEQLRKMHEKEQEGRSRFHKSICPICGALVTNQAIT